MSRILKISLGVLLFGAGCAASQFVVPRASAQRPAPQWDYFCFYENDEDDMQAKAKKAGQEGWELAAAAGGTKKVWCFKRPL